MTQQPSPASKCAWAAARRRSSPRRSWSRSWETPLHAAVDTLLPAGQQTGAIQLEIRRLATTPVGMNVTVQAELLKVEKRTLTFRVRAEDEMELIGEGTHQRAIIDVARFQEKVQAKAKKS